MEASFNVLRNKPFFFFFFFLYPVRLKTAVRAKINRQQPFWNKEVFEKALRVKKVRLQAKDMKVAPGILLLLIGE